ncbi:MAG: hypothetical protein PVF34_13880, partial [Gammaproteobacteria bacterium]
MRRSLWLTAILLLISLLLSLNACNQQKPETQPDDTQAAAPAPVGDIAVGKTIAEQSCAQCHGIDGATSHNGAPFL